MHFFSRRWASILASELWQTQKWVLGIDGDTLPIRMNASFGSYLESPEDIILGMREQGEVHAAAVLFRTSTASCGTGST